MALITQSQVVTQTEIISPMTARVYLEKNKCNRNISHAHRDKLARAMIAGEFRHTHQGIAPQQWQTSATRFRDWWMISKHTGGGSVRVEICQRAYTSMFAWVERRPLSKLYAKQTIEWLGQLGSI